MRRTDIHVHPMTGGDLQAWQAGEAIPGVPPLADVTLVWLTLVDDTFAADDVRQAIPGAPVVVVLQQGGVLTPPAKVWPFLLHHASRSGQPVRLLLSGGAVLRRYVAWQHWLTNRAPGQPPLRRLMLRTLVMSLLAGHDRLLRRVRRLSRLRGRT